MRARPTVIVSFLVLTALGGAPGAGVAVPCAASAGYQDQDDSPITLGAELVVLDVSVADRTGRHVMTIPKDQFEVLEDGVKQDIEVFERGEAPASFVLVLDASGSMRVKMPKVTEAAARVLEGARAGDEFAVVEFREDAHVVEEFTSDPTAIRDALAGLEGFGQTAMVDAAYVAANYAQREGRNRIKAVVMVTDGLDKNSFYTTDNLTDHLRRLDVRFYVIGFTADLGTERGIFQKSERARAEQLLTRLTRETGGQAFFPASLAELNAVNDAIAADLRTVYSIGYYPKNTKKDGSFRSVAVRVLDQSGKQAGGLSVRTRSGYVAGK